MMSKVDPCLFMYKTVTCVVCVDDCLFWENSQYEIDNVMKSFKEDGTSYNWEHSNGESVSEFLGIYIKTLHDGSVKYNWFRLHVGKEFVIRKIHSENQKADIFTKDL